MTHERITVVLSQAPGKHPGKRALEEAIVAGLLEHSDYEVAVVPNLYDLHSEHSGLLFLQAVRGDLIVLSWLYPRAAFWVLDRHGIKGQRGATQLGRSETTENEEKSTPPAQEPSDTLRSGPASDIPDRYIYTLDLRDAERADDFLTEIDRIAAECCQRRQQLRTAARPATPTFLSLGLALRLSETGTNSTATTTTNSQTGTNSTATTTTAQTLSAPVITAEALLAPTPRRWYPVIDYSRCTNCLECLDFCLFGVYGVDSLERILVENPDQCKKGCPACSRVCPQQAIIFPEYKSPAIAGADLGGVGGLKIDLSKLFGGEDGDALSLAVAERDRELVNAGRQAVGMSVGIPKRQAHKPTGPKDELDKLVDDLDKLGL
jgi:NAD-dependent dihydropyrimidine dehydrogenase PreA subunit